MIEKHSGRQQMVCDCGFSQRRAYEVDEFDVMVCDAKEDGWKIQKLAGEWTHTCPACAEKPRAVPGRLL